MGLTLTATPLVAGRLPGVMTPVPFAKTPVRKVLPPVVMVVALEVKLLIVGAAFTVTVAIEVAGVAPVEVTVSV